MDEDDDDDSAATTTIEYSDLLAKSLFGENKVNGALENEKLLSITKKARQPLLKYHEKLQKSYSSEYGKSSHVPRRSVNDQEIRTLDAPDIIDDYYTSIIDWSTSNVIAVALSKSLYIWPVDSTRNPTELFKLRGQGSICSVYWPHSSPNIIAIGTERNNVNIWDVERGLQLRSLQGHNGRITCINGFTHILSSGSADTSINNWDLRIRNALISTYQGHISGVCNLKWNQNGTTMVSCGSDENLLIWSSATNTLISTIDAYTTTIKAISFCPWQNNLVASGAGQSDGTIKFWNIDTNTQARKKSSLRVDSSQTLLIYGNTQP